MLNHPPASTASRRRFLTGTAVSAATLSLGTHVGLSDAAEAKVTTGNETVRDRLWLFACPANSDFPAMQRRSVMTPVEGAYYMGIPNLMVVQASEREAPFGRFEPPFAQYAVAMRPLKRVVWSIVGSGGFHSPEETEEVMELAKTMDNFAGIMLDDFFTNGIPGRRARLKVEELAEIRRRLKTIDDKRDICVTLYTDDVGLPIDDYLELVDVITLWNMSPDAIRDLEENLRQCEEKAPRKRIMLGCYVVDYGRKRGMPVDLMKRQCEMGLKWLRQGRIQGIIFLGNTTLDMDFPAVEWTRKWISEVGDEGLIAPTDAGSRDSAAAKTKAP